jgi:hypothetical protein
MESTKKSHLFLIVFLLLTVVGITAIDIYQDRVIEKQRYELKWLLAHSTIRPETILADVAKGGQGASKTDRVQAQAASVTPAPSSAPTTAPAPHPAKP